MGIQAGRLADVYLDNNATTRVLPEAIQAMAHVMSDGFGNASSSHSAGERAREALVAAREAVAGLLGIAPSDLIFTSGATEANNIVLRGLLSSSRPRRLITTAVEHSSISTASDYVSGLGVELVRLGVDSNGLIDMGELEVALTTPTGLVSIAWANNETGVLQPVERIGALCRLNGVPFHTDGSQAVGKHAFSLAELPIDFLSFTGHKLHAPQGVGGLAVLSNRLPIAGQGGGDQEGGRRGGTENLPGIVGLGVAARIRKTHLSDHLARLVGLRDRLERGVLGQHPNVTVNGAGAPRVGNTSNLRFVGIDGQALVARLDLEGVLCSQSSACTNMRPEPSYVLQAMGLSEEAAYESVRFGLSVMNTELEIDRTVAVLGRVAEQLRTFSFA